MPAKSLKQKRLMDAAAHNPAFAKRVGIPRDVAMDFSNASKGKTFNKGGDTMMKMSSKMKKFEKSSKDVETKGVKEGSKKDMMMDTSAMGYNHGGRVQVRGVGAARARTAKIC